jgi:hypothetical protein
MIWHAIRKLLYLCSSAMMFVGLFDLCALTAHAEPISTTAILTSLAISAATTGASFLAQRLLAPKPKVPVKGKLQGEIQLSDSSYNVPILELYGARYASDLIGGVRAGLNFIWANRAGIREHRQIVQSGTGGGGKGAPRQSNTEEKITYDLDLAGLVGHGPLNVLQVKFGTDIVYDVTRAGLLAPTRYYESEAGSLSGGAFVVTDPDVSSGQKVQMPFAGVVSHFNLSASFTGAYSLSIYYQSTEPIDATVYANGVPQSVQLPNSDGLLRVQTITVTLAQGTTNSIVIGNSDSTGTLFLDRIFVYDNQGGGITGVLDEYYPVDVDYNHFRPPHPYLDDPGPRLRHSFVPRVDVVDQSINTTIVGGVYARMTIYEGNDTQDPDPLIQADVDGQFGLGSTPAYLDECYLVFEKLNISKYNGVPQISVLAEHKTLKTLSQIVLHRAQKVGCTTDDLDLTQADNIYVRGFAVSQLQAPAGDMTSLARFYNFTFVEDLTGRIVARDLSNQTIAATLTEADLGAYEVGRTPPVDKITTKVLDQSQRWESVGISFFNPDPKQDFGPDRAEDRRPSVGSHASQTFEFNITATKDEALRVARRILQKHWEEADPHTFTLQHRFANLTPADRIRVPIDGELRTVRLEEIAGSAPGLLGCSAVFDEITVIAGGQVGSFAPPATAFFPSNTVGTFLDIPLLHPEALPGMYIAATPRNTHGGAWPGAIAYRNKGEDWQRMTAFTAPATMAVTVNTMPDVPGGWTADSWDDTSTVTLDFYGTQEPNQLTDAQVLDGAGIWVIGDEVCAIGHWTRDNAYPNRWIGSHIRRRLKGTDQFSATHTTGERAVLMNSALRFIPMESTEKGVEREWALVTTGARLQDSAKLLVTWTGDLSLRSPVYDGIDVGVPTVTQAPTVVKVDGSTELNIYVPFPDDHAFSLMNCEIRARKVSDDSVFMQRQIGTATTFRIPQPTFDLKIDYRWRNRYRDNGSDGWSAWSPYETGHGSASGTPNPNDSATGPIDNDPNDVGNPIYRRTYYSDL